MSAQLLICIHAHDHVESLFMLVSSVSQSTLDSISIKPWRNNKGTAVGAFDLWERANAGRLSEIDAGSG